MATVEDEPKEDTMIYLFNYRDAKAMMEERRRRSLKRLSNSGAMPPDSYRRQAPPPEADVVELVFGAGCDADRIGA